MPRSFRSLKRGAVRPDWNKHTLFSLSRLTYEKERKVTFFQQKWKAKSLLRDYHHPDVREKKWSRMFDRRLPAVVPMSPALLARSDGREFSAGRGSGLTMEDNGRFREDVGNVHDFRPKTPYMQMTFFPLEKRLDTAVFRALFASSVRQARSMILHGGVTVNGKKMLHPGYLLNPGDMFQVEPDRVLYATGAPKRGQRKKAAAADAEVGEQKEEAGDVPKEEASDIAKEELDTEEAVATPDTPVEAEQSEPSEPPEQRLSTMNYDRKRLVAMQRIITKVLDINEGDSIGRKRVSQLRKVRDAIAKALDDSSDVSTSADSKLADTVDELHADLVMVGREIPLALIPAEYRSVIKPRDSKRGLVLDQEVLDQLLQPQLQSEKDKENQYDPTKPYRTPWQPRKYMSAFAFIPRYLEVNQNICAAVYLRHPVARPGIAEVPTPFHPNTAQLAFNWYLKRR